MNQAVSELEIGGIEKKRKKSLIRYIALGTKQMIITTEQIDKKLKSVTNSIVQIEGILAEHDMVSHSDKAIEQLHVDEVLRSALNNVHQDYKKIKIRISKDISELPEVTSERIILTQIFTNLLNNSFESILSTQKENGQIDISGEINTADDDSKIVHISIKDNGIGLTMKDLETIFERGVSKKDNGTGFGLHWCSNAIYARKGKIYAESQGLDKGAIFHILIPVQS